MLGLFKDLFAIPWCHLYYTSLPLHLCYVPVMFSLLRWSPLWEQMEEILGVGLVVVAVQLRGLVCVTLWSSPGPKCLFFCNFMLQRSIVICKTVNFSLRLLWHGGMPKFAFTNTLLDACNSYLSYLLCFSLLWSCDILLSRLFYLNGISHPMSWFYI